MTVRLLGFGFAQAEGMFGRETPVSAPVGPVPAFDKERIAPLGKRFERFGRQDPLSLLTLAGVAAALTDAGLFGTSPRSAGRMGLVAATYTGCLGADAAFFETVIPEFGRFASPQRFIPTLPSTALGEASILHDLTGPVFALFDSPRAAVELGFILLAEAKTMLAGWVECGDAPFAAFVLLGRAGNEPILSLDVNPAPVDSMPLPFFESIRRTLAARNGAETPHGDATT